MNYFHNNNIIPNYITELKNQTTNKYVHIIIILRLNFTKVQSYHILKPGVRIKKKTNPYLGCRV